MDKMDGPISYSQCLLGSKSASIYAASANHRLLKSVKQYLVSEDQMC